MPSEMQGHITTAESLPDMSPEAADAPSAPVETATSEPEMPVSSDADSTDEWGETFDAFTREEPETDDLPLSTETTDKATETETSETPSEPAPPAEPAKEPAPEPQAPTAETEKTPEPEATPQEPAPGLTPEQQAAQQQARDHFVNSMASKYEMTEEQKLAFDQDPTKVLPQIAAQVAADSVDMAVAVVQNLMAQQLPKMITQVADRNQARSANEEAFYSQWPELKGHSDKVLIAAQSWRQANPQASKDEFMKQVGPLAWMQAGLPIAQLVAKMGSAPQQPAPAAPPAPTAPSAYAPTAPRASVPVPPAQPTSNNEFELLAMDREFLDG
jgi:hypothetical protein